MDYDASPNRIDEPVDGSELAALLSSDLKAFAKNPNWLVHLLTRVAKTIDNLRRQIFLLHRDVQQATVSRAQMGAPTTLNPIDGLRFLTPEQRAIALDEATRATIDGAEKAKSEAKAMSAEATRMINEMKLVVGSVLDDPTASPSVRQRLEILSNRLSGASGTPPASDDLGDVFGS